jgi:hypothetical protein
MCVNSVEVILLKTGNMFCYVKCLNINDNDTDTENKLISDILAYPRVKFVELI